MQENSLCNRNRSWNATEFEEIRWHRIWLVCIGINVPDLLGNMARFHNHHFKSFLLFFVLRYKTVNTDSLYIYLSKLEYKYI